MAAAHTESIVDANHFVLGFGIADTIDKFSQLCLLDAKEIVGVAADKSGLNVYPVVPLHRPGVLP